MSVRRLNRAAKMDRIRREDACVEQMVDANQLTEPLLMKAMERQKAVESMRTIALYLETIAVVIVGAMGIAAKQMFNTRGDLRFYTFQMTLEIIFFTIVVIDVASSTTTSRFVCVIFFVIAVTNDFSHILIQIRRHGVFFKCTESDVMLQHCLFKAIPTHHHGLYVSAILFALHLAIILANVSAVIFYDKSLDYYMEITPGKPQFVTNLPIHQHEHARAKGQKSKPLTVDDLPPGTRLIREQEESSVRYTIIGRDGKEITKPHDVTITRKFTLKAPGMSGVTAQRSWKKQGTDSQTKLAAGKSAGASKPLTGSSAEKGPSITTNVAKSQEKPKETLFECPCGGPAQESRGAAGKDPTTAKSYSNAFYETPSQLSEMTKLNRSSKTFQ